MWRVVLTPVSHSINSIQGCPLVGCTLHVGRGESTGAEFRGVVEVEAEEVEQVEEVSDPIQGD